MGGSYVLFAIFIAGHTSDAHVCGGFAYISNPAKDVIEVSLSPFFTPRTSLRRRGLFCFFFKCSSITFGNGAQTSSSGDIIHSYLPPVDVTDGAIITIPPFARISIAGNKLTPLFNSPW